MNITAPQASALGIAADEINVPVVVHIRVNTTRHSSEWATDFIKRGRPFIFELLVNGGESSTVIANKLIAAFVAYEQKFNLADKGLPYTWTQDGAVITTKLKEAYLSFQSTVDFLPKGATYGVQAVTSRVVSLLAADNTTPTTLTGVIAIAATSVVISDTTNLRVGDVINIGAHTLDYTVATIVDGTDLTITPGLEAETVGGELITVNSIPTEPAFDGKYLEENVRMSTMYTSDSYGISPDEKPFISGGYTTISFVMSATATSGIDAQYAPHRGGGNVVDEVAGNRQHKFTLYFLDGSDNFVDGGNVEELVGFLVGGAPTIATFLKGNGQPATSADDFRIG